MVTPSATGLLSLNAVFQGTANYVGSTASVAFNALGPVAPPPPPSNKCPLAQGFWKNHPSAWPVTSLTLGSQSYTETELLTILRAPVGRHAQSDASMILADALISAKLDIANGSDPTPVTAAIADADKLLSGFSGKLPYHVKVSSTTGQAMVHDAGVLNQYEDDNLTPNCTR